MALLELTDQLQAVSLSEYLLFSPTGDKAWLREKFDDIPRYLFRVSTPRSDGTTDKVWVRSKDAKFFPVDGTVDLFANSNDREAASMLNRHLRWKGEPENSDNLVSWTSSLLFALQYIFYRRNHQKDQSPFEAIDLCIIDTTAFPKGVFLRDMDLMDAYSPSHPDVKHFQGLRTRRHYRFCGSYYFGEYLSQGALKIEAKCKIVSAQAILDQGLLSLQPLFQVSTGVPKWADEVIALREDFYQTHTEPELVTKSETQAAIDIAQLFGPHWRLPVAANLLALRPRRRHDEGLLRAFRTSLFTGPSLFLRVWLRS